MLAFVFLLTKLLTVRILLLAIISFLSFNGIGQTITSYGTEFWFGYMKNGNAANLEVYITSDVNTCGKITLPLAGFTQDFTVSPNTPAHITVPAVNMAIQSEFIENKGAQIITNDPVNVYILNHNSPVTDAALIYPVTELGQDYYVYSHDEPTGTSQGPEIMVVATKANTQVEITPRVVTKNGKPAGVPFTVTLNAGQVYQVQFPTYAGDPTGTRVRCTNNKDIVLFGGNSCTQVRKGTCDHIVSQILPPQKWGTEYIGLPFATKDSLVYKILASQNNTAVTINGGAPILINAGQFIDTLLPNANYFTADKNVAVAQYCTGQMKDGVAMSDPFFEQLWPLSELACYTNFTPLTASAAISVHHVNILVKQDPCRPNAKAYFDGAEITGLLPVPGLTDYGYKQYTNISTSVHTIKAVTGFQALSYGFGGAESYGTVIGELRCTDTLYACTGGSIDFSEFDFVKDGNISWNFGDGSAPSSAINPTHVYATNGNYTATLTSTSTAWPNCSSTWSVPVKITPLSIDIGPDINSCIINETLDATLPDSPCATYLWSTGATTPTININAPGQYSVIVDNGICQAKDTMIATLTANASLNLGNDTVVCAGSNFTLDAGAGWDTYLWNTAANTQTIIPIAGSNTYSVEATNAGCTARDTIVVLVCDDVSPPPYLFTDTVICEGESVIVNHPTLTNMGCGIGGYNVTWTPAVNEVPITANSFFINPPPTETTTYTIVQSLGHCPNVTDTMTVTIIVSPDIPISIGDTVRFCEGDSALVTASLPGLIYDWSTGETTRSIYINAPGKVWIDVSSGGCSGTDTVLAIENLLPIVNLGNETTLCTGDTFTLDAGNAGATYIWSTDESTQTIDVIGTGTYWVEVDVAGCKGSDTVDLTFRPLIALVEDTVVCDGINVLLDAGEGTSYLWNTGETTQTILVNTAGQYTVVVTDGDCVDSATADVTAETTPSPQLGIDTSLCEGSSMLLDAGNANTYLWSTGETINPLLVTEMGEYWVVATNECGAGTDTIEFVCYTGLYVPNAFTPNANGANETFSPKGENITDFAMWIFDRWGEMIFTTDDMLQGWDGKANGGVDICPEDVYVYLIHATNGFGKRIRYVGHVSLIR